MLQPKKVPKKGRHNSYAPEKRGSHLAGTVIMLRQNSQKTLRQLAQKAHDNGAG